MKEDRLSTRSRIWIAVAAVAALFVAAMGVLAVALPRLVNTPEFRTALAVRAGEALGTPVAWKQLEIGFFPPRVILDEPVLVGQDESVDSAASIRAQAIDLRLAWLPLLERRIAIESLVLHGVDLVATRTPDGFVLPEIARRQPATEEKQDDASGDSAFVLDLRELRLDDARVLVHDRTLSPPVDWRIESLSLTARGRSLGDPLELDGSARLFADARELGGVSTTGKLDLEGEYALDFMLERILLAELYPLLPDVEIEAGEISGPLSITGTGSALERITTDVEIAGLRVRARGVDLTGDLGVRAQRKADGKISFEASWAPPDSGGAGITGERSSAGDVELTAMLDALELAPFAALAGPDRTLSGRATGEVSLSTAAGSVSRVETDLAIESARYADAKIDATGKLDLALGVQGLAPESPVRIQAVFAPASGGRVDVNATGTVAGALRASLRFDAFDVKPLAPLWPSGTELAGKLTGELELESTAERELLELESRLRIGGARLIRSPVDVSGDLSLDARIEGSGPVELVAKGALADGGRIQIEGTSTRKGILDLRTELSNFDLAIVTPFLGSPDLAIAGRATGKGTLAGPYDALVSLSLDLALTSAALQMGDATVEGPLTIRLDLAKPFTTERSGTLALGLSEARVVKGTIFQKPAGVRLEATTRFENGGPDETRFDGRIALHNIDELLLRGTVGPKMSASITSSSFDLKGWSSMLPALAQYEPAGVMAFEGFSVERSAGAQDRFAGRIVLRSVDLTMPGAGRVRLRGNGVGSGERIVLNGFSATLHGLTLGLEGRVEDPLATARFDVAAHSIGEAEVNDFVSGLSAARDTVFGALRFDAQLAGIAGGEASLYDTLSGNVRFTVGESGGGRLRGVSLLRTTLAQIPLLGGANRLAARLRENPDAPDYLGESFELLEGDLAVGAGEIDARTLRIRYRGHEARLTGRMQLEGLGLDMRGELLLDAPLVAALAGRPASELAGRGPVRIPLARVTNTLSDPKVSLSAETLASVPQLLLLTTGAGRVVDKAMGKVGDAVGDAIGKVGDAFGKKSGSGDGKKGKPADPGPVTGEASGSPDAAAGGIVTESGGAEPAAGSTKDAGAVEEPRTPSAEGSSEDPATPIDEAKPVDEPKPVDETPPIDADPGVDASPPTGEAGADEAREGVPGSSP